MSDPYACSAAVRLHAGREIPVRRGHPWVYRRALDGALPDGLAPVVVEAADRTRLGIALPCASGGSLALRMVATGDEGWSPETVRGRLGRAIALRRRLAIDSDAFRVAHAEGDGFPGLVVDCYAGVAVFEPYEPAWEPYLGEIGGELRSRLGCETVIARPAWGGDGQPRALIGSVPSGVVIVREGAYRLPVDVARGQKTGLFLDQRDNRRRHGELALAIRLPRPRPTRGRTRRGGGPRLPRPRRGDLPVRQVAHHGRLPGPAHLHHAGRHQRGMA